MASLSSFLTPDEFDSRFPRVAFYMGRDLSVIGYCALVAWGRVDYESATEGEYLYKKQIKITYRHDCWRQLWAVIGFWARNLLRVTFDR